MREATSNPNPRHPPRVDPRASCFAPTLGAGTLATAAPAAPTTGFLSKPTDQIAVPGMISGGEITPEGDLYTGWAEYELRFGRRLVRMAAADARDARPRRAAALEHARGRAGALHADGLRGGARRPPGRV